MKALRSPGKLRGVTLIELMISLVIGLVVVGAVLISFVGSGRAGRYQAALGQMNQDAQVGLNLLAREIQLAGYVTPGQSLGAPAIFGCDSTRSGTVPPFAYPEAAVAGPCMPWTAPSVSALEVVYEADSKTTVPTAAGAPSDCLGNGITPTLPNFYITRNRYYIKANATSLRNELQCSSPAAGGKTESLVENVEDMQLWYGIALAATPETVVRYAQAGKDASTPDKVNAVGATEWNNVNSVRICLLMRSAEPILTAEDPHNYFGCDSGPKTSPDNVLRRAYFTTAMVRTKMPLF